MKKILLSLLAISLSAPAFAMTCTGSCTEHIKAHGEDVIGDYTLLGIDTYGKHHIKVPAQDRGYSVEATVPDHVKDILKALPYIVNACKRNSNNYVPNTASVDECEFPKIQPKPVVKAPVAQKKPVHKKVVNQAQTKEVLELKKKSDLQEKTILELQARLEELERSKNQHSSKKSNVNDSDRNISSDEDSAGEVKEKPSSSSSAKQE